MFRFSILALAIAALVAPGPARADDLAGVDRFLCSIGTLMACFEDGECERLVPTDLNVPQFVEVDLKQKRMSTTKASGENRSTPIVNVVRGEGRIVLQGHENRRAFSFVIEEATGLLSAAVATEGLGVAVFGACTPVSSSN
jgi:hypothetical protein